MLYDIDQCRLDDYRVITQIADRDVAPRAQEPPDTPAAAGLPRVTAPVIMINMPALNAAPAAGIVCAADRAPAALRGEHRVKLLQRQPVPAQVDGFGVLRVLLAVDFPLLTLIFSMTRPAVGAGQAPEVSSGFRFVTSAARPFRKISVTCERPLVCGPRLMLRSAVSGFRARSAGLELERVVPDRANPCLGSHSISIHGQGRTCIHESYPRSVGRLAGRPVSANRENCWDARTTLLSYNVRRKPERECLKISEQGQSAAKRTCLFCTAQRRCEGSETMYVAPH